MEQQDDSRRDFLKKSSILAIAGIGAQLFPNSLLASGQDPQPTPIQGVETFTLPELPYAYDALEPHIDVQTMEIHHKRHHQGYVNALNLSLRENKIKGSLDEILKNISTHPIAVRNNAGGHWNHSFFWKLMGPGGGGTPSGKFNEAVKTAFGDFYEFKKLFSEAAAKRFGSGWAWLVLNKNNKLEIGSTPNQDNPLMDVSELKGIPIMGVDVWEHAYYLKYQNLRGQYLQAWWNLLNWDQITKNLEDAQKG
ncbi:MAG: superoxide dismutase [Bacteroidia bacterium]|nr:superoxide dismutase [Bacteroidia bacterium]